MNSVTLMGRLTKDPELRYTQGGTAFTKFYVACSYYNKDKQQNEADFVPCTAWGTSAQNITKYLHKGSQILVQGDIKSGSYEKDGQKIFTFDVRVLRFEFCGSSGQQQQSATAQQPQSPQQSQPQIPEGFTPVDPQMGLDEDLPF